MAWITIVVPVINTLLDFCIKILIIVLLYKLIPLIKNANFFNNTKSNKWACEKKSVNNEFQE